MWSGQLLLPLKAMAAKIKKIRFVQLLLVVAIGVLAFVIVIQGIRMLRADVAESSLVVRPDRLDTFGAVVGGHSTRVLQMEGPVIVVPAVRDDASAFERLAHRCTDKATAHRYQQLYARMLYPLRHGALPNKRLLEMGLGCNMPKCVAGGARLFMSWLPTDVVYHVLEYMPQACRNRYSVSSVTAATAEYIDTHLCEGSSADHEVLAACGQRFGPFDVIIDDASHLQPHVMAAFRYWFLSPHLKSSGVYIVEDLQVIFYAGFEAETYLGRGLTKSERKLTSRGVSLVPRDQRQFLRLETFGNVLQALLLCKFSGRLCGSVGNITSIAESWGQSVSRVVIGRESGALRKRP